MKNLNLNLKRNWQKKISLCKYFTDYKFFKPQSMKQNYLFFYSLWYTSNGIAIKFINYYFILTQTN